MCGRFTYKMTWKQIHDLLEEFSIALDEIGDGVTDSPDRYNIAPTQPIIVIHPREGKLEARLMRWGLVPTWVKDPREFSLIINARVETILEKPSFRGGLQHHRCLVPASGYYEWRTGADGKKQPFYMTAADGKPLMLGGVYSTWMGPSGEEIDTTAIVTVPATSDVSAVHDRMPALIPHDVMKDWLDVRGVDAKRAFQMLVEATPPGTLQTMPVSTRVNSNRNEGPDLITPVTLDKPEPPKRRAQGELF